MSTKNPYAAYQSTQTVTASQTQLIVMLHDGAIRFLAQAAIAITKRDWETKSVSLNKATNIIDHLWGSLDKDAGGEIAENLERIYGRTHIMIAEANVKDDVKAIKEMMSHLREIREAWAEVDRQARTHAQTPDAGALKLPPSHDLQAAA